MNLTNSFTLEELTKSDSANTAALLQKQQSPPAQVVENLKLLAKNALQPLRDTLNHSMIISSGYRCPEVNVKVGGSVTSQHVLGQAADLILDSSFLKDPETQKVRDRVAQEFLKLTGKPLNKAASSNIYIALVTLLIVKPKFDQLIIEFGQSTLSPAWIHISYSKDKARGQILRADGKYTALTQAQLFAKLV
jgi:hypothetical protein